ncbi:SpoIIE family protein phosphatase [Streptomyces sp. DSM 44917]|uniref:SpoIIE family protein phosphatase n=1 Tax=Streptomyces boetiae TaxID=3075541 RepID=A0ABU2LFV9_9ACTN|nr:SpoIIE family protein phosphatase [Streptomyces sp. DSM 44917]MDT0310123.1 SpoIIE family protein phosphatase [Streptomyces sp. DSM 44917]
MADIRSQPGAPSAQRSARLRMLTAVAEDRGDTDVLLTAMLHATAELGGLGAMAHLLVTVRRSALRLVVSTGLPGAFVRAWETIADTGPAAPVRAVKEGVPVFLPRLEVPEQPAGKPSPDTSGSGLPSGAGIAAVPLPGQDGPFGVLSVITAPGLEPDEEQWAFLQSLCRWAAGRLRLTTPRPEGLSPALLGEDEGDGTEEGEGDGRGEGSGRGAAGDGEGGPDGQGPGEGGRPSGPPGETQREPKPPASGAVSGSWDWDLGSGQFTIDEPFLTTMNIDQKPVDFVENWADRVHPDDQPYLVHNAEEAIRGRGSYAAEYRVRRADGSYAWLHSRGKVLLDEDGEAVRLRGRFHDNTAAHAALEPVAHALRHMTDGFLAVAADWRIQFVNVAAERVLGSPGGLTGRLLWDVPGVRDVPGLVERCREAVAGGEPAGFDAAWPGSDRWYHLRLVPVPDGGLTLYITDITERRLRQAAERAAAERAALVARLTRALAEAITAQDVVEAVAGHLLPAFGAAGLVVYAVEGGRTRVVGSVGYSEEFRGRVHGMPADAPTPIGAVMRSRTPQFFESMDSYRRQYPQSAGLASATGKQAWAFLPLTVSGHDIGTAVISFARPRRLDDDDRALLTALSGLIAQALERASLFDDAATRARELQRALLPRALPSLPAAATAARYLPAGRATEVGGDWYDVIPLSSARLALVIGDVMGHGMAQAAIMGRLRTAVRTLADLELAPDDVLGRLNDVVAELGEDRFATCLYGIYDPVGGELHYASAGHPPPALTHPDGRVTLPSHAPNPPLGIAAPPFDTVRTTLPDGSLLALYTDGLVESRARDIDTGIGQLARLLARAVEEGRTGDLDALCESLTGRLLPGREETTDDAALLLARTRQFDERDVATWRLPENPVAAGEARDHVREQLAAWNLGGDLEMTTELIVSELVGNVVRHAKGPVHLRLLRSTSLIVEVSDGSLTTPHIRHTSAADEGGRGLQLVAAMAQRWGARYTPSGKCIWTEQPLP